MKAAEVAHSTLRDAIDLAVTTLDSPTVDLGPALGLPHSLKLSAPDLHEVVQTGQPTFLIEWDEAASLTVRKTDGGLLATLEVRF